MKQISFIILTWNSSIYISDCVDSIKQKCDRENVDYEIIIIDNGSIDETIEILNNKDNLIRTGKLQIVSLPTNQGTTAPRNIGLRKAKSQYVCIMDSDTEIISGSLLRMLDQLRDKTSIGLIAPCLVLPNGMIQNSVKKFPSFFDKLRKIPKALFGCSFGDNDFYSDFPFKNPTYVDSAISACWFFKKELLNKIGYLDERIFYSPEDLDYCMRIRKFGYNVIYWPDLKITHHTQQISHKSPFSKVSISHLEGLIYYYRKHGGWFSVTF